jgi:peptidoglycan/xylan/chitin deacetylase (PgdA/CDA1 family)
VAAEKGFKYVVMWDVDTNDWRGRTAGQITETVMGNAHNGAIVLMHMAAKHTAEALPTIIKRLRVAGYELVTLSTMLGL